MTGGQTGHKQRPLRPYKNTQRKQTEGKGRIKSKREQENPKVDLQTDEQQHINFENKQIKQNKNYTGKTHGTGKELPKD